MKTIFLCVWVMYLFMCMFAGTCTCMCACMWLGCLKLIWDVFHNCSPQFWGACMPRYIPGEHTCGFVVEIKSSDLATSLLVSYWGTSMPVHFSFGDRVSLNMESVHLTRLALQETPGMLLSPPPQTGITTVCRTLTFLTWPLEIEPLALMLVEQALYWMNYPNTIR